MATRILKSDIENNFDGPSARMENYDNSLSSKLIEKVIFSDKKAGIDGQKLQLAKAALHISTPERLPARETEIRQIQGWIERHLIDQNAGGMYISGSPGTGKSAVVEHVLDKLSSYKFKRVNINCMNVRNQPNCIFEAIAIQLKLMPRTEDRIATRLVSSGCQMIVLVLDEVDQLLSSSLSSSKTVLKTVFEWPLITGCRLILVGIANALDLSTHHLPKYFTTSNFEIDKPSTPKPKRSAKNGKSAKESYETNAGFLMHFTPYKKEDITKILEDRLNGNNIFDPSAIKFVATKVASSSGDIRKALNACKIALESVEQQERRQGLKVTADDGLNPGASPKKQQKMAAMHSTPTKPVGVLALSKVLTSQKDDGAIPLQQAIILLTLHKINSAAPNSKNYIEDGVQSAIPIDRVYTEHLKVCEQHMFPRIDRSDLPSACSMLQDRSLITVIQRAGSCSPSASSPKARGGTLKRGLSIKAHSSGMTGVLFDPRAVEIALRSDPVMNQQLKMH